jgi:hypothetical protein
MSNVSRSGCLKMFEFSSKLRLFISVGEARLGRRGRNPSLRLCFSCLASVARFGWRHCLRKMIWIEGFTFWRRMAQDLGLHEDNSQHCIQGLWDRHSTSSRPPAQEKKQWRHSNLWRGACAMGNIKICQPSFFLQEDGQGDSERQIGKSKPGGSSRYWVDYRDYWTRRSILLYHNNVSSRLTKLYRHLHGQSSRACSLPARGTI